MSNFWKTDHLPPLQVDESSMHLSWNKPFDCGFPQKQSDFMVVNDLSDTWEAEGPYSYLTARS